MVFLMLAILSSTTISIVMRISSDKVSGDFSMLATNYLICAICGAVYAKFQLWMPTASGFSTTVWLGVLSGVLYLAGFAMLQQSVQKNGMVLSSVFMKLGLLVPIFLSVALFHEAPTLMQILGFVIAIGAIVVINLKKDSGAKGFSFGLIALLLMGGGADAMSKFFEVYGPAALSDQFLFYTFAVAFLLCVCLVVYKKERPGMKEILFGTLIGIPNFFSAKFLLGALTKMPAVVVYPSFSVATLLLITLTGVVVFRERLSKLRWAALGAIVVALVLLNL